MAEALARGALMSTVNLSEVAAKLADIGMAEAAVRMATEQLGLEFVAFDEAGAVAAGLLRPASRSAGLSLGDRACIALGQARSLPVLTADLAWSSLDLGPEVQVVMIR